jgi:hypothetical protein
MHPMPSSPMRTDELGRSFDRMPKRAATARLAANSPVNFSYVNAKPFTPAWESATLEEKESAQGRRAIELIS